MTNGSLMVAGRLAAMCGLPALVYTLHPQPRRDMPRKALVLLWLFGVIVPAVLFWWAA